MEAHHRRPGGETIVEADALDLVTIDAKVTKAGDQNPTTDTRSFGDTYIVARLIYGLMNVRTDVNTSLCATLNEKDNTWRVSQDAG